MVSGEFIAAESASIALAKFMISSYCCPRESGTSKLEDQVPLPAISRREPLGFRIAFCRLWFSRTSITCVCQSAFWRKRRLQMLGHFRGNHRTTVAESQYLSHPARGFLKLLDCEAHCNFGQFASGRSAMVMRCGSAMSAATTSASIM